VAVWCLIAVGLPAESVLAEDPAAAPAAEERSASSAAPAVQDNMDVGLDYTLIVDGAVVESTEGKGPFHYRHGGQQVLPALERALTGLHVGDATELTVGPEEGYGQPDPGAFVEVPTSQLPEGVVPEVGLVIRGVNPDGQSFPATVSEIKGETVVLDLNHPLAGKTLTFKVKVVDIAPAVPPILPPSGG
jgi:FKBP-type peptidyl-prolyl cis-trans isomerase SlyD